MSQTLTLTCDCGCGKSVTDPYECGWFTLSQLPRQKGGDGPKLERDLQFSGFKCLSEWSTKATSVLPELQESGRGLYPRGSMRDRSVSGLFI